MQRNREPIYLGLVKWSVTCVNCPCCRPPPRHLSSCIFHLTVSSISVTRSGPKSTTTLKHFAFMRQMRHGQDTDQPSHSCPFPPPCPLLNPSPCPLLPWQHCHKSFSCAALPQNDTRQRTALGLGLGLSPGLRYEPVRPLASRSGSSRCHQPCSYCSSPAPTSRVVCTFWRSQIVLLPVDSTNWKVFTSSRRHVARAAANSRPSHRSWPQSPLPLSVAVSLCRCPQPFNNKNFEQKFRGGVF